MRLTQPQPRRPQDDALIPLINVVFLMLIFFMIAGQIRPPEALNIDLPTSRQGQLAEPERILLSMDRQARIALDGEILPASLLSERLAVRLAAASAMDDGRTDPRVGITLKADAAVTQGQLRALLDELRSLGVERLRLLSQPMPNEH